MDSDIEWRNGYPWRNGKPIPDPDMPNPGRYENDGLTRWDYIFRAIPMVMLVLIAIGLLVLAIYQ